MKVPRDISGQALIKYLKPYGYTATRQTGSHIRLTTQQNGQHHITIPHCRKVAFTYGQAQACLAVILKQLTFNVK